MTATCGTVSNSLQHTGETPRQDEHRRVPSFTQEAALLSREIASRTGRFPVGAHFPVAFRLHGVVAEGVIEDALDVVIRRHGALHSALVPTSRYSAEERLVQLRCFERTGLFIPGLYEMVLDPRAHVPVRRREGPLMGSVSETDLWTLIRAEAAEAPSASVPPMLRATLVNVDNQSSLLVVVLTHLVVDGWSVGIFRREFASAYRDRIAGTLSAPQERPMQYPDFAMSQYRRWTENGFVREEQYWNDVYTNAAGTLIHRGELPFSTATPGETRHVTSQPATLPTEMCFAIRELVTRLRLTPYTLFRTAMALALHHYTTKRQIAFWANFANRAGAQHARMIGPCATRHLITTELNEGWSCAEFCRHVAQKLANASAHQTLPLAAWALRMGRRMPRSDTNITFDYLSRAPNSLADSTIEPLMAAGGLPWVDFDVRVTEEHHGYRISVSYDGARYQAEGVRRFLQSMLTVLAVIAEDEHTPVWRCRLLLDRSELR